MNADATDRATASPEPTEAGPAGQSVGSVAGWSGGRQRSRLQADVPEDTVAAYSAARAFLLGEWFGASLAVASFTLLYLFAFAGRGPVDAGLVACVVVLILGAALYLRSRTYYLRIGFDYAPRWHIGALVVAGAAGIFWLLFVFLAALAYFGFPVLPD